MDALDLYCGAGGASMGLAEAGFKLKGIDINQQPEYPFDFCLGDALEIKLHELRDFDFIWASPPCQAYSWGTVRWRNGGKKYPDLISKTRRLLDASHVPYVIENVVGAPIKKDLLLCGEMFKLPLIRHRIFEIHGFNAQQPPHGKHKGKVYAGTAIGVWQGGAPGCWGSQEKRRQYVTVAGHGGNGPASLKSWQKAMGINWVTNKKSLSQCVPPAYSRYIGQAFLDQKC